MPPCIRGSPGERSAQYVVADLINRHDLTVEVVTAGHGTVVPLPGQEPPPAPYRAAGPVCERTFHSQTLLSKRSFLRVDSTCGRDRWVWAPRRRPRSLGPDDLNDGHHAAVLMRHNVTMVHKFADHHWVGKRDEDFHLALDRQIHLVLTPGKRERLPVDFNDLEIALMHVKDVLFVRHVPDRPFLDRAQGHVRINAILIKLPPVDVKLIGI